MVNSTSCGYCFKSADFAESTTCADVLFCCAFISVPAAWDWT